MVYGMRGQDQPSQTPSRISALPFPAAWVDARPILTEWDRLLWIGLPHAWTGWKGVLPVFTRKPCGAGNEIGFRRYWAALSKSNERPRGRRSLGNA
jgi:hypothetical protein